MVVEAFEVKVRADVEFATSETCVKYFRAGVKFSRIKKNPQFSIFGQKCRNLCIFLGKIEKFGNLTGVKDFTNSTSGSGCSKDLN